MLAFFVLACGGENGAEGEQGATGARGMGADLLTPGALETVVGPPTAVPSGRPPAEGAESALCGDLEALTVAMTRFRTLSGSSGLGQLRDAVRGVRTAWEDAEHSIREMEPETTQALRSAMEQFLAASDALDASGTFPAAYVALLPAAGTVEPALTDLRNDLRCPA